MSDIFRHKNADFGALKSENLEDFFEMYLLSSGSSTFLKTHFSFENAITYVVLMRCVTIRYIPLRVILVCKNC